MLPYIPKSQSSVSRWFGPGRSYTPDPGEFPLCPGATASTAPLKNTTPSQLQIQLKIPASTNTGCCMAQFKHLCWNCLHCVAFRKTLYYTRLNYINTHFIIKNCNTQTLIFPVELSIGAFASLQNPRIKPYTCSI